MQRTGRAGREGPGFCFRLYTEEAFKNMPVSPEPEIMRVSLTSSILKLKCLDQDLEDIDLMDKPERDSSTIFSFSHFEISCLRAHISHLCSQNFMAAVCFG